jgi:soluble lytic murein transglycosylase-like protein
MKKNRRKRRIPLLFSVAVACAAVLWTAKQVLAANTERGAQQQGTLANRAASLAVLSPGDIARYRQIFALQRDGRFKEADRALVGVDDRILLGHMLAERYLHPKAYKSSYEELAGWLREYAELPQAYRIYRLAALRQPRGAKLPPEPAGVSLLGAGQELREESFSEPFLRRFRDGIDAWRRADYSTAAIRFSALADDPDRHAEELAAAAFWAARAQLRIRRPEKVAGLLRKAARASDEFYGLLAQRLLDERIRFDWQREEFRQDMVSLLLRYPAVRRAIALGQIGEHDLAEGEVRKLAGSVGKQDTQALTALAAALELPSAQMRLAQQLRLIDGRRHDGAMFPIPRWKPPSGFRLDRTLVYAIIRAESAFDIEAESPRGALGLMQLMPDNGQLVAKGMKLAYNGPESLLQPETNLEIGQTWLRRLMRTSTIDNNLVHLIVAYNAGEARLKGWLARDLRTARKDPLLFIESIPLSETRGYTKKVLGNLWAYQTRLGQPTPVLQALAENRWPEVTSLDTVARGSQPAKPTVVAFSRVRLEEKPADGTSSADRKATGSVTSEATPLPVAKPDLTVAAKPAPVKSITLKSNGAQRTPLKDAAVARPAKRLAAQGTLGKLKIRAAAN